MEETWLTIITAQTAYDMHPKVSGALAQVARRPGGETTYWTEGFFRNFLKPVCPYNNVRNPFRISRRKSFHCDVCNEKFETLESMEEHRRRLHRDAAPNADSS
jgi:hypothetical protein